MLILAIGSYVNAADNLYVGEIVDSDGYVNVREGASTKSKILSVINAGEEFIYEYNKNSNWYRVYNKEENSWIGYIYKSKVKNLREYTPEEMSDNTNSSSSTMEIVLFLLIIATVITIYTIAYKNVKAEKNGCYHRDCRYYNNDLRVYCILYSNRQRFTLFTTTYFYLLRSFIDAY